MCIRDRAITGIPPVKKDYVLSIYEVPSQLPLSASSLMKVGQFEDGTNWEHVSLDGGIFANNLETNGTVNLTKGAISARKSLSVSADTTVGGRTVASGFDALGAREARAADTSTGATQGESDFYDASVGGNVGKVAFIPINPGNDTLIDTSDGNADERISPTGWNFYSRVAPQAKMTLEIRKMSSKFSQIPTQIRLRYRRSDDTERTATYTRGSSWPTETESGGDDFPFQTDVLQNSRNVLVIKMEKLPAFVNGLTQSGGINANNSLYIFPRTGNSTVIIPSIPSQNSDMAVSLRESEDLTAFTNGFSLISRYRTYIADSLNIVPATVPANAGLPSGEPYFPPFSLFAPEKRFGESLSIQNPVVMSGQLSSLKTSAGETFNPLELKNLNDERVSNNKINAHLVSLRSPAELPPVYMMNWLITIEEIH